MKEYSLSSVGIASVVACMLLLSLSSCAKIPIKDGGLVIGKDTTASIKDVGVATVSGRF